MADEARVRKVQDRIQETVASLENALASARAHDEEVARRAEGAQYAGEADPYRKPEEEEEQDER